MNACYKHVGPKIFNVIYAARENVNIDAEIDLCRCNEVEIITDQIGAYPRLLRDFPDPPCVLFVKGQVIPADAMAMAVVGSRHATHYGLAQAERLAAGLAGAGLTVVSGLARGIDAAAHRGALSAGGRTIAVLASSVLNDYPPENQQLARPNLAGKVPSLANRRCGSNRWQACFRQRRFSHAFVVFVLFSVHRPLIGFSFGLRLQ